MKQAFQFAPKTNPSKMNPKIICSKWLLLLLLLTHEQGRAKPVPNAQALSQWLEEDLEHPTGSEEMESEEDGAEEDTFPWPRSLQEGLPLSESAFQRVFGDLLGSSRRYKGRSKKGLSRSCFGVKLDRIGALSGLGC